MTLLFRLFLVLALSANGWVTTAYLSATPSPRDRSLVAMWEGPDDESIISFDAIRNKRVLVVGGSGRVGGSVVTQLVKRGALVTVGGTNAEKFELSRQRWETLFAEHSKTIAEIGFVPVNRESTSSVTNVLQNEDFDLVVHTAGPFQGKKKAPNGVLEGSIANGVAYIDVCDDYCTASAAKSMYMGKARDAKVPCIISTGCWPGVSSLMASLLIQKCLQADKSLKPEDLTVDFGFFTAGSGGAGATLLVATFLILAEDALTIRNGRRVPVGAMKDYTTISFGKVVGEKPLAHLNLLETASIHEVFGVGNIQALFGTDPGFWNALLGLMAQLPSSLLSNEEIMTNLALFSLPIVRVVDFFAGATNAMRCDVTSAKNIELKATAIYAHENLEPCVGECVVAFCAAMLSGQVDPGVYFPEEAIIKEDNIVSVLSLASVGAHTTTVESNGVTLSTIDVWGSRKKPEALAIVR